MPEFAAPIERIVKYVKKWRKVPQIFTVSYDFGGGRFVGVFNCWQKGEAFFTLKAAGLAPGRYTVSSHDGILWTKSGSAHSYTAEELAQGVFLSVGACRTRVFEIVPEGGKPCVEPKSEMTAERLRKAYEERRAALAVATWIARASAASRAAMGAIVSPLPPRRTQRMRRKTSAT